MPDFKILKNVNFQRLLDPDKWLQIVEEFGSFPKKYRPHIWTRLLKLPRNFSLFNSLMTRSDASELNWSPPLTMLYPDTDINLLAVLQTTLSCLCEWCPSLKSVTILPCLILPWVRLFEENPLICFEVSVVFLLNWFRPWLETLPASPPAIINAVEELLSHHDLPLWVHLNNLSLTPDFVLQPIFSTCLAKVSIYIVLVLR